MSFSAKGALTAVALAAAGTLAAAAPAAAAGPQLSYLATIRVDGGGGAQFFKARLIAPDDVQGASDNLNGTSTRHINGRVVRTGPDANAGYTWHLDPYDVAFVDISAEVCDGVPSFVAGDPASYVRFCPWRTRVVDLLARYDPYKPRG
ncbi:hypothetical protein GCM10010124_28660 [Pilimelia terevasa]|uniref:BP74 N-terminal domain-containing protein n=1 Tax=Pilimelia terevasa TaxID=53372 RepID=A0A8J3BPS6_9ACTN|nr:hypothetical protein [Pilimelia terevasa]GGK34317.1 hypothetical protein GCM10010124_28660 [Pilimelia terevasa]